MYRGKPATHEYIVAVTWVEGIQLELMQPVKGYSIYNEYLEQNKGGFHHVKILLSRLSKGRRRPAEKRIRSHSERKDRTG